MADKYTLTALASATYTTVGNWIGGVAPVANDNVFFQFDATLAMAGSDQSATELDDIYVLPTCSGNAGSAAAYLQLDQGTANKFVYAGGGVWYVDLGTAGSAAVRVDRTVAASNGNAGLYLKNNTNAITLVEVNGGVVRLVSATVTTLVVRNGATVYIDPACTVVNVICDGGNIIDYGAAVTTWTHNNGTGTKYGTDTYTVNLYGGVLYNDGTGTATANVYGGLFNTARDTRAKSVTLTYYAGQVLLSPNVTVTGTYSNKASFSAAS